jgi:hypothetical protein
VARPGPVIIAQAQKATAAVEIKIGVQHAPRELSLESSQPRDDVEKAVAKAMTDGGLLTLSDERGRTFVVSGERISYVEIGEPMERRVGFGTT